MNRAETPATDLIVTYRAALIQLEKMLSDKVEAGHAWASDEIALIHETLGFDPQKTPILACGTSARCL